VKFNGGGSSGLNTSLGCVGGCGGLNDDESAKSSGALYAGWLGGGLNDESA
jgi:hypothetical protein